jgi:hypothetical protein
MIHWLLWKQSLDPRRFATNHPDLAPALTHIRTTGAQQVTHPPKHHHGGGPVQGQQIPEPSAWLLALTITGCGLWWRHRLGVSRFDPRR